MAFVDIGIANINFDIPGYVFIDQFAFRENADLMYSLEGTVEEPSLSLGYVLVKPVYYVLNEVAIGCSQEKWFDTNDLHIYRIVTNNLPNDIDALGIALYPIEIYPGRATPRQFQMNIRRLEQ